MKSQEYRSILGQLPIKSPTPQDMVRLCPHLTAEEAVMAFTTGSGFVALPPLRIRHGFQIVSHDRGWVEKIAVSRVKDGTKNHPAQLNWSYAGRTRESYADGKSHGEGFLTYKHMDKAMKFAEDNWGDELILDNWDSVVEFWVQDPTDLVNDRYHSDYPRLKVVLYVTLSRDFNDIISDCSKPQSEIFDDAILQMTLDKRIWHELNKGHRESLKFNCANCGAGLSISYCNGCGHRFRDDHYRSGWHTPLSRKMIAFLRENGHEFKVDPNMALTYERQSWKRNW